MKVVWNRMQFKYILSSVVESHTETLPAFLLDILMMQFLWCQNMRLEYFRPISESTDSHRSASHNALLNVETLNCFTNVLFLKLKTKWWSERYTTNSDRECNFFWVKKCDDAIFMYVTFTLLTFPIQSIQLRRIKLLYLLFLIDEWEKEKSVIEIVH